MSEIWASILTALLVVLGGAFAYWNQKRLDRINELVRLRRTAYQRFVEAMIATTSADARRLDSADDRFQEFLEASAQLTIVASDTVLEKLADFQIDRSKSALSLDGSSSALLLALRKDVFEGSKVSEANIKHAFPIKFGSRK